MAHELWIDRNTGSLRIGDLAMLQPHQQKDSVAPLVADLLKGSRDHGNGFEWLDLHDLTFGGQPATLSICFHNSRLESVSWSVELPDAPMEGGWPTRKAIDSELSFVRAVLARDMGIHAGKMSWGEIGSSFDAKGFMAANDLRYSR